MLHRDRFFDKLFSTPQFKKISTNFFRFIICLFVVYALTGCATPRINIFPDATQPLQEFVLQGEARDKILVIPIRGTISDAPDEGLFRDKPSLVEEVVAQLRKAEKDKNIRAVVLKIDSPGGTVTGSDILYEEITSFKKKTGAKVVTAMMDVTASGGYYVALAGDVIYAHPTTITGSVGVLYLRPQVVGLMNKIGVDVDANKSGKYKDMGSPFRKITEEEERIIEEMIDSLGERFIQLISDRRNLDQKMLGEIATARIYLAPAALQLGLVDKIGYLPDALDEAQRIAGISKDSRVIAYRRTKYGNDTIYNTVTMGSTREWMMETAVLKALPLLQSGFYYLWYPGLSRY